MQESVQQSRFVGEETVWVDFDYGETKSDSPLLK